MEKNETKNEAVGILVWLLVGYLAWDFVRPHDIFPVLKYARLSLIITLVLALPVLLKVIEGKVLSEKIVARIICFFLLGSLSLLWVGNQGYWGQCFRGYILIIYIEFLGISVLLNNQKRFMVVINAMIIFHVFIALYGVVSNGTGPGSFLSDENDLALALNSILPIAYFLSLDRSIGAVRRWVLIIAVAIMILGVISSNSRGGFVGLAAAIGVCFLFTDAKRYFIYAVLVFGLVTAPFITNDHIQELRTIADTEEGTADGRLWSWKLALDMFKDHPLLGVGMCNYRFRVGEYEKLGIGGKWGEIRVSLAGRVSHSIYFTIIPELGTVGIVLFLMIVYQYFNKLLRIGKKFDNYKSMDLVRRGLVASMLGFLVTGAFLTVVFDYPQFWLLCGMAVALSRLGADRSRQENNKTFSIG